MTATKTPVVFIHGRNCSLRRATRRSRPDGPATPTRWRRPRAAPQSVAGHGIDDVTSHYTKIIDDLPSRPVLIGHSFGGMIAEKLLGMDYGAAAVAIDAAQIKGVLQLPLSSLRATSPVFKNPANKHKAVSLTEDQFRYSFGNALSEQESGDLYQRLDDSVPGPAAVRGRGREFHAALTRRSRHQEL